MPVTPLKANARALRDRIELRLIRVKPAVDDIRGGIAELAVRGLFRHEKTLPSRCAHLNPRSLTERVAIFFLLLVRVRVGESL